VGLPEGQQPILLLKVGQRPVLGLLGQSVSARLTITNPVVLFDPTAVVAGVLAAAPSASPLAAVT